MAFYFPALLDFKNQTIKPSYSPHPRPDGGRPTPRHHPPLTGISRRRSPPLTVLCEFLTLLAVHNPQIARPEAHHCCCCREVNSPSLTTATVTPPDQPTFNSIAGIILIFEIPKSQVFFLIISNFNLVSLICYSLILIGNQNDLYMY